MLIFSYILHTAIFILLVPVMVLLVQVIFAVFAGKTHSNFHSSKNPPSVAILMPAHNETLVITQSITSITPQLKNKDRLIVVADNCTDDTASIARSLGAEVIERVNQEERGKGYALDFGLQFLKKNPADVVIVVDADCIVKPNAISHLASACIYFERPMQALYLMEPQSQPSLKARVASFAWAVKNHVRPLGFKALNLPCQLMGTGMAFLWQDISKVNLASGHIVEDMKLGTDLAKLNKAPMFFDAAVVTSIFPPDPTAANTQRARWEHGHLSVILNEFPKLFLESIRNKNLQMFSLALDLLIPPLAMLTLVCLIVFIISVLSSDSTASTLSMVLLGGLSTAVLLAWLKFGRSIISFKQLCYAPFYVLTKIPLYIKFFMKRQVEWVRSKRD